MPPPPPSRPGSNKESFEFCSGKKKKANQDLPGDFFVKKNSGGSQFSKASLE